MAVSDEGKSRFLNFFKRAFGRCKKAKVGIEDGSGAKSDSYR